MIAIHQHEIPDHFPDDVLFEAEQARAVELGERTDLRNLPLFTIDPSDARDHDDAICAKPDDDPNNIGGHIVWVAIADVAYYVQPGSSIDIEARKRGNSSYFPDRVVPMLPDALSGNLCSLHEGVDRACMSVCIKLSAEGTKLDHQFHRGIMRSPASLSYEQAQGAFDGNYDNVTKPLAKALKDLLLAYKSASKARDKRQPLNLDLPERKIVLSDDGEVLSVDFKNRFEAHKLVEEFMVMANVCAAETLEANQETLLSQKGRRKGGKRRQDGKKTKKKIPLELAAKQTVVSREPFAFQMLKKKTPLGVNVKHFVRISVALSLLFSSSVGDSSSTCSNSHKSCSAVTPSSVLKVGSVDSWNNLKW